MITIDTLIFFNSKISSPLINVLHTVHSHGGSFEHHIFHIFYGFTAGFPRNSCAKYESQKNSHAVQKLRAVTETNPLCAQNII